MFKIAKQIGKVFLCVGCMGISLQSFATRIERENLICSTCGKEDSYTVLLSTNMLEPGSLDSRPGEMMRSAIISMIKQCKSCGLVSYDITQKICDKQDEIVASDAYQAILKENGINELSRQHQAYAYLLEKCGKDKQEVVRGYLDAAWAADDANETDNANLFRKKIISYLENSSDIQEQLLLIDLYRRTAQFAKAFDLISKIKIDEGDEKACYYKGMIDHQKELLKEQKTNDQRVLYATYCPPKDGDDRGIINTYIDAIMILKRSNDLQEARRLQLKLIPYLENKTDFMNKFVLTYFYYQTNQNEKAQILEKELVIPNDWNGFFKEKYGNWILGDMYLDQKSMTDTPFYRLARKMLDVRYKRK